MSSSPSAHNCNKFNWYIIENAFLASSLSSVLRGRTSLNRATSIEVRASWSIMNRGDQNRSGIFRTLGLPNYGVKIVSVGYVLTTLLVVSQKNIWTGKPCRQGFKIGNFLTKIFLKLRFTLFYQWPDGQKVVKKVTIFRNTSEVVLYAQAKFQVANPQPWSNEDM